MKVVLGIYANQWASTQIAAAWIEFDLRFVNDLLHKHDLLLKIQEEHPDLSDMSYAAADGEPYFVSSWPDDTLEDEELLYPLDEHGNEFELHGINEHVVLRDDQTFPQDAAQQMTMTWMNVEKQGIWWESRDDETEDKVETTMLTRKVLDQFKAQLEANA
jgi:hypothetical protein